MKGIIGRLLIVLLQKRLIDLKDLNYILGEDDFYKKIIEEIEKERK